MRPRSPILAGLAVVAVIALGLGLDRLVPVTVEPAPPPGVAGPARSGAWYCAAGDTAGASELRVVAAVAPGDSGAPAEASVALFAEGQSTPLRRGNVFPSSTTADTVPAGENDIGVAVRWWDLPVAVTRVWRVSDPTGVSGVASGPCLSEPSDRWLVPGVATAGGAQAVLHLANPFDSDATVVVTLTTPDGLLAPRRLENVVVPRRSVREIPLNEHAPERPDLGIVVDTLAGRVVAEAVQSFNAAIGGVEGLSLAAAAPAPAETWTIPWVVDSEERESWLWVSNPGDRAAAIELTIHTDRGGTVPEGFQELSLEPGHIERIDLRGLLPDGESRGAVTVRSENGEPVVASVGTQFLHEDDEDRTGIAVQLGSTVADADWIVSGGATGARDVAVHLVNPTAEDAIVDLALWAGAGLVRPAQLQGIRIGAGATEEIEVTEELPDAADHTVFVTARRGRVIAGSVASSRDEQLEPVVTLGIPLGPFAGGAPVAPVRFEPGLPQRLGTELGPGGADTADVAGTTATEIPTEPEPAD